MKKHCDCFFVERVFKKEGNILNLYFLISIIGISKKTLIRLSKVTNYLITQRQKKTLLCCHSKSHLDYWQSK